MVPINFICDEAGKNCPESLCYLHITLNNHPPEVSDSVNQRSLASNVGLGPTCSSDVVGIDIVTTRNPHNFT